MIVHPFLEELTNDDTFENMNFTSAKIVACSSLKATENNINCTTLMTNKKRKLEEVNLQDHIYTCKYLVEQYTGCVKSSRTVR